MTHRRGLSPTGGPRRCHVGASDQASLASPSAQFRPPLLRRTICQNFQEPARQVRDRRAASLGGSAATPGGGGWRARPDGYELRHK